MKTLMVSHLWQLLWAEAGTPGRGVPGAHRRAPEAPNPAPRGRLLQRDNFPPAPCPLPVLWFCLARNPRAGMGTRIASASGSQARGLGTHGELEKRWRGGRMARGMGDAQKQQPGRN